MNRDLSAQHGFVVHCLFVVQCYTYYTVPKCIVKYLRILFLYSDKYTVTNTFFFHKNNVHSVQSCTYSGLHTKQKKNLLYAVTVKKK